MRADFDITCTAFYSTHLDIPDELITKDENGKITKENKNAIANYIQKHRHKCKIESDLEWLENDDGLESNVVLSDDNGYEEEFFVEY